MKGITLVSITQLYLFFRRFYFKSYAKFENYYGSWIGFEFIQNFSDALFHTTSWFLKFEICKCRRAFKQYPGRANDPLDRFFFLDLLHFIYLLNFLDLFPTEYSSKFPVEWCLTEDI